MAKNNFDLTLDTLAPVGSITRPHGYVQAQDTLTINVGDATYMKVWFDNTASYTEDADKTKIAGYTNATWVAANTSHTTTFTADGEYYYHVVLMDTVNNESVVYSTEKIIRDGTAPTVSNVYMADLDADPENRTITNALTVKYGFEYADTLSGAVSAVITCADLDTIPLELDPTKTSYEGQLSFKAGTVDGTKTISVVVTDAAGNKSIAGTANILLDTHLDIPTLTILTPEGESIPNFINYTGVKVHLKANDTNIVAYKIWEEGTSEPEEWTTQDAGTLDVTVNRTLAGEGLHTFYAKVKDSAGNTKLTDVNPSVTLDTTAPEISISSDRAIISNVEGYTTAVLTLTGTDSSAGIKSYSIMNGEIKVSDGSTIPGTVDVTSTHLTEGSNTLIFTVIDNAENVSTETVNIVLDTTAPTVSLGRLNSWYNGVSSANPTIPTTLSFTDANTKGSYIIWVDQTPASTAVPGDATSTPINANGDIAIANIPEAGRAQSAANYVHVKVVDQVGNVSYAHQVFGYDTVAPEKPTVSFSKTVYPSTTAQVTIIASDATSGIDQMRIAGDIDNPTAIDGWEDFISPRDVTLTNVDGIKTVTVIVKDTAGNISEMSVAASCELDTSKPVGTLAAFKPDGITSKESPTAVAHTIIHVGCTDDNYGNLQYKLYGDFAYTENQDQGITESAAEWKDFTTIESGKGYVTLNTYLTNNIGTDAAVKHYYLQVRDNAGNISEETVTLTITYDHTDPIVDVHNVDHNRISKIHVERRNSEGTIAGQWADEVNFSFTPNENIIAYKVCAYMDAAAAGAVEDTDEAIEKEKAIGTTNGSVNMSATGLSSNATVGCKIKGADYEAALGKVGEVDGAHYVVVYVKNEAGKWSAAGLVDVTE